MCKLSAACTEVSDSQHEEPGIVAVQISLCSQENLEFLFLLYCVQES